MSGLAVQRFYRLHARVYDSTRWIILRRRRQAVARLGLRPDSHVLEVGCGTGLNFRYILEHVDPARGRLVGADFSPEMLARARRRVAQRGWSRVELVETDATRLNLGERFDAVLFAYSLTMIPDWALALRRAADHLRGGGRLVVLDFANFSGWGPLAPLARAWLRLNHVETRRPYVDTLRDLLPDLQVRRWLGGYCFAAAGTRAGNGTCQ